MSFWLKELDRAQREERDWVKKAKQVIKRYKDDRGRSGNDPYIKDDTRFNILWSTTETLRPNLISSTPRPECRPRYKKKDPVARIASKILERALEFSLDQYDFVRFGRKVVNDYLLVGRGVARVKYVPTFEKIEKRTPLEMREEAGETIFVKGNERVEPEFDDEGAFINETVEELVFEDVFPERVPWKWFRIDPADSWESVNWVAFGAPFSKDEGIRRWGSKFLSVEEADSEEDRDERMKGKTIVWEIWDKRTRKQLFVAEGLEKPLEENDDPLKLEDFFPVAEPIYTVQDNDTLVPIPEFCLWQDQADELDLLSERIRKVTEAIKARGAYAGSEQVALTNILESDDNELVPIEDWMAFIDKGGLDGIISWVPVEQFARVLQILEQQRAIKIQEIFELTGVSDVLRGASDPRETASAQRIKERSGNRRLLTKQDSVERLFRDIYRIKAEIIAENFDPNTLRMMVGLESVENEVFNEAVQLIKSDVLRAFSVDIETDSTIAADEQKEKEGLAEAMQATASFVGAMFPLVQAGALPPQVGFEILRDYFRKFRFGRRLDDLLEEFQNQQPPDAQAQEQQAEMQKQQQEMQMEMAKMQAEIQAMQEKAKIEIQKKQAEIQIDGQKASQDLRQDEEKHDQELRQDMETHAVKVENERELGEVRADVQRKQAQARPTVQ